MQQGRTEVYPTYTQHPASNLAKVVHPEPRDTLGIRLLTPACEGVCHDLCGGRSFAMAHCETGLGLGFASECLLSELEEAVRRNNSAAHPRVLIHHGNLGLLLGMSGFRNQGSGLTV